jgi:hypothetical protein
LHFHPELASKDKNKTKKDKKKKSKKTMSSPPPQEIATINNSSVPSAVSSVGASLIPYQHYHLGMGNILIAAPNTTSIEEIYAEIGTEAWNVLQENNMSGIL